MGKVIKGILMLIVIIPIFLIAISSFVTKKDVAPIVQSTPQQSVDPNCGSTVAFNQNLKAKEYRIIMITGSDKGYATVIWQNLKRDWTVYVKQSNNISCIIASGGFTIYAPPSGMTKI